MELDDLKLMWQNQEKQIAKNTKLNREILRYMLIKAPQRRMNKEKFSAIVNIALPLIIISVILIPNIELRNTFNFYLGVVAFAVPFILTYTWSIQYFLTINKIDFTNPITTIKKRIKHLERQKTKITKLGFMLMPVAITGIFIMGKIELFTTHSLLPLGLIILIMIISGLYTFKIALHKRFTEFKKEIEAIENLEKD